MYGVKLIGFVFTAKVPRVIWALIVLHTEITARLMTILLVLCVCVFWASLGGGGVFPALCGFLSSILSMNRTETSKFNKKTTQSSPFSLHS